ncbi:MAG: tetratricopeptide repeat protein, partial [Bacteroidia bacterium]
MTRIILFVFFLTITLSGFGQSASKFFKAGDTFMSNSMYEDAVEQFTNAIEMNPNDTKGYIMRAEAFQKAGRPEEAYDDIEKARIFDPKNPEILLLCGRICNDMGRYEEALDHLNYATSIAKREETLYPEKVRTLNALGQYDLALKVSDTALLYKEDALNYYQRGLAFEGLLNDIRAQADYEKAVRKNKKYEPARLALGYLLIKDGNLDEAMEHAEYLISENDRDTDAYLLRSKIYSRQLNYPNAINDASRNILIEPDNPMHYATRGL